MKYGVFLECGAIDSGPFFDLFNGHLDAYICTIINIDVAKGMWQTRRSNVQVRKMDFSKSVRVGISVKADALSEVANINRWMYSLSGSLRSWWPSWSQNWQLIPQMWMIQTIKSGNNSQVEYRC